MKTIKVNNRWDLTLPKMRAKALPWSVWEHERLDAMYKTIRKGDTVLDIGTEFGDMSALYSKWCGGKMILVEPSENYWAYIKLIFEANNCPIPLRSFVGFAGNKMTSGNITIDDYPDEADNPLTVEGDEGFGFRHLDEQADVIPVLMIDNIVANLKVDIVNIDIEGAEYQALLGAEQVLTDNRPIFFISVHPEFMWDRYKNTSDDLIHHMELHDYKTTFLGQDHEQHYMFRPL